VLWPHEWFAVGIAATTTVPAAILTLVLAGSGVQAPYLAFLFAVAAAAVWGGGTAGVCAAVFSSLLTWFFFIPPVWSFAPPSLAGALTVALLFGIALLVTHMWQRQRRTIDELTDTVVELRSKLKR
jgi:K+-sensing histidine kinase KdpD